MTPSLVLKDPSIEALCDISSRVRFTALRHCWVAPSQQNGGLPLLGYLLNVSCRPQLFAVRFIRTMRTNHDAVAGDQKRLSNVITPSDAAHRKRRIEYQSRYKWRSRLQKTKIKVHSNPPLRDLQSQSNTES